MLFPYLRVRVIQLVTILSGSLSPHLDRRKQNRCVGWEAISLLNSGAISMIKDELSLSLKGQIAFWRTTFRAGAMCQWVVVSSSISSHRKIRKANSTACIVEQHHFTIWKFDTVRLITANKQHQTIIVLLGPSRKKEVIFLDSWKYLPFLDLGSGVAEKCCCLNVGTMKNQRYWEVFELEFSCARSSMEGTTGARSIQLLCGNLRITDCVSHFKGQLVSTKLCLNKIISFHFSLVQRKQKPVVLLLESPTTWERKSV